MEGDEYLTKFHGSLLSLSVKGLLYKPPDDGQMLQDKKKKCEIEELSNVIANLSNSAKKKIAYYMILNTELKVSDDLRNDEFIGLFVNITPAIPLQAFIQWIVILDLVNEVCTAIENTQSVLGEELVNGFLESQVISQDFYFMLWCSVFKKIYKTEKKNSLESSAKLLSYFKIISQKLQEYLDFRNFSNENSHKLEAFLSTVLNVVTYYKNPDPDDEMYKLSITLKAASSVKITNEDCIYFVSRTVSDVLNTLNFENWSSFFSDLQNWKTVRNLSYRLLQEIKLLKVPDDVLNILSKLAKTESDTDFFISNAEHEQKFNFPIGGIVYASPYSGFTNEHLDEMLHRVFEKLDSEDEEMKKIFIRAVSVPKIQPKWLEKVFENYQPNLLTTSNTSKNLVQIFNKISNIESVPLNIIIPLCMQSPVDTIEKLCRLAMSSRATNLEVFQTLKPACQVHLPIGVTLLNHVIMSLLSEEFTSAEEDYFRRFIVDLRKKKLINSAFLENLIKKLKEFLKNDEMNKAVFCLTVIDSILVEMEPVNKIALLVFMSQVLGHFSWDLGTFSTIKANGRDVVYSIVSQLMACLDFDTNREILNRAREEILKCWEVNQACFCDLWFRYGKTWHGSGKFDSLILALIHSSDSRDGLRQFLLTFDSPREVRTSVILALTKVLPVLTLKFWDKTLTELKIVWTKMNPSKKSSTSYEVFQMFVSAWYLLTLQLNRNNDIQPCYGHCMGGFGRLFASVCLEGELLVRTYEMILFLMKSIEDEKIRKSCYMILLPVLKDRLAQEEPKAHSEKIEKILKAEFKNQGCFVEPDTHQRD